MEEQRTLNIQSNLEEKGKDGTTTIHDFMASY
jgi:hypothetical protein